MKGKILVTGGTGYIGSHTTVELIHEGYEVVIVDDLSNSHISVLDNIEKITGTKPEFHQIDLRNGERVKQLFNSAEFDGIIHFAAKKAVGESVEKPLLYYDVNINSLVNLLSNMKSSVTKNLVFSSSCTVYGQPDKLPVTEETPFKPAESPYGNTKQICEEILDDTTKASEEISVISLRYFNPVGAHESALIGELPLGIPNNLVPFITQTAAGKRDKLKVFGGDYDTPDGSAIRDYIHVVDLAKAHIIALERLLNKNNESSYEFFNLGTGKGSSVLEVIKSFEKSTGVNLPYEITDRRPGDVIQIYADTQKATRKLGWTATHNLDDMISSAWKWQKNLMDK